ncbi:rhomboid family intramembrane serine protease [Halanaerobiaceae bacterium Z-7014]|uniref:Rhomboid family intramembrane serine protease n=1 Tax=Halonatronomonas betaini TaxID=2778430 RepID=A0A931F8X1_9FIRM|nr:rhomboid family intramembrane serine protease [Halonatronomonas betaini]MBF8435809.1 rhomboid family intramembrane serine protease [Halonatronomonas betaini]
MLPLRDNVPRRRKPIITGAIIAANILVYIWQSTMTPFELRVFIFEFGLIPGFFIENTISNSYTILTSTFLHGGIGHLVGNMWILALFGDNVEDRMGRFSFLGFYILSGIVANFIHLLFNSGSTIPTIGASGAVAGIMAAYVFLFPLARVVSVIPIFFFPYIISIPAIFFIGIWFLTQLYYGTIGLALGNAGGVAWWAHIGGFIFGAIFYRFFLRKKLRYY